MFRNAKVFKKKKFQIPILRNEKDRRKYFPFQKWKFLNIFFIFI